MGYCVISADKQGIVIKQCSGELLPLPPDLSSTEKAAPGEYTLRATGEVVVDPDYLATWSLYKPKQSGVDNGDIPLPVV